MITIENVHRHKCKMVIQDIQGHVFLGSVESQRNNVGLIFEDSEDTATEITENCRLRALHCMRFDAPLHGTSASIRINLILLEAPQYWSIFIQIFVVVELRKMHIF